MIRLMMNASIFHANTKDVLNAYCGKVFESFHLSSEAMPFPLLKRVWLVSQEDSNARISIGILRFQTLTLIALRLQHAPYEAWKPANSSVFQLQRMSARREDRRCSQLT